uniref:Putative ixostatin n=1 Tax=Ixodes ricinus TaxID=34613 RepID=A0A0K8RIV3_IXORI
MIVTGIFLMFAAVPLVCVAEGTAVENQPDGCTKISSNSLLKAHCEASLMTTLGNFCSMKFPGRSETDGQWLGTVATGTDNCRVCCVYSNKDGIQYYNVTKAPDSLPCAPNKK